MKSIQLLCSRENSPHCCYRLLHQGRFILHYLSPSLGSIISLSLVSEPGAGSLSAAVAVCLPTTALGAHAGQVAED